MMKNSKLKFSEYMQNISRSKSFGKFVLIVRQAIMLFAVVAQSTVCDSMVYTIFYLTF